MNRHRHSVFGALLLGSVLALVSCDRGGTPPGDIDGPRHVFLFVIDTLRADHLGCYGYDRPTSPVIDRLAERGVLFENALANSSNTMESMTALFTSATALTTHGYERVIPPGSGSLQTLFAQAGYNTLAVISNPWLKLQEHLFREDFRHYEFVENDWADNTTEAVTRAVMDALERAFEPGGRNFFYIHYLDPHDRYLPPADYGFHAGPPPRPRPITHQLSGEDDVHRKLKADPDFAGMARPAPVSSEELEFLIAMYDGEIRYVDEQIGILLDRLEEMGALEDSLIAITSDHGEEFLEHGLLKHGFQLYDETLRIPLILHAPGFLKAGRRTELVNGLDLAPTLLEAAGIAVPERMFGQSLLGDPVDGRETVFCTHFINQRKRGMQAGTWKLIENLRTGEIEVYDLQADPEERTNLHEREPERSQALRERFARLLLDHLSPEDAAADELLIDPETRKQLEELGYLPRD